MNPSPGHAFHLGAWFDRSYQELIRFGLLACLWFSAFERAAYDSWAACAVFAWFTLLGLVFLLGRYRSKEPVELPFIGPAAFVLGAVAASTLHSYDITTSHLEAWIWFFCFMGFYLFINTVRTGQEVRTFFTRAGYVLIPLAVLCVVEQLTGQPVGYADVTFLGTPFHYGHWEIHATLINSIVMCGFALFWGLCIWENRKTSALNLIALVALIVVLVLGRSWWAGMCFGLGFLYRFKEMIKKAYYQKKKQILLVALALSAIFLVILYFKLGRHQTVHYAGTNRFYWWLTAARMVQKYPLTGVGIGAYGIAYPYFRVLGIRNTLYAHSFPLQLLSEVGILGFAGLLWLAAVVIQRVRSSKTGKSDDSAIRSILLATLVIILTYSLINISLEYFLNKLVLFLTIAALIIPDKEDYRMEPGLLQAAAAVMLILLVPLWAAPLQAGRLFVMGLDNESRGNVAAARGYYADAISVDSAYADPYAAMARTYRKSFQQNRSASDLAQWRLLINEALRRKKDIRYVLDLTHPPDGQASPALQEQPGRE